MPKSNANRVDYLPLCKQSVFYCKRCPVSWDVMFVKISAAVGVFIQIRKAKARSKLPRQLFLCRVRKLDSVVVLLQTAHLFFVFERIERQ